MNMCKRYYMIITAQMPNHKNNAESPFLILIAGL